MTGSPALVKNTRKAPPGTLQPHDLPHLYDITRSTPYWYKASLVEGSMVCLKFASASL